MSNYNTPMLIRKGFKFRLEPTDDQLVSMNLFAGHNRAVWNKSLALIKDRLERKVPIVWFHELNWLMVNVWKKSEDMAWLNEAQSQTLIQTLKHLDRAVRDGFDKKSAKKFPTFKKKIVNDSFTFPQGVSVEGNRVKLPKLGFVKFRKSRELDGKIKSATVSRSGKYWFVSILCEKEVVDPIHPSTSAVGIDRGVTILAACSDGKPYAGAKATDKLRDKLCKQQRLLARKVKHSNNWKKQVVKVQGIYTKISNMRKDTLHKATTEISNNHVMIILEKLKVSNMSKSAKGTSEKHGTNVRAKSGMNRSILDAGWSMFKTMLQYKQAWKGGYVEFVPAPYTSQKCSCCGYVHKDNRPSQPVFSCIKCKHSENADFNAARNILNASGYGVKACGVTALAGSMKQELFGNSDISMLEPA